MVTFQRNRLRPPLRLTSVNKATLESGEHTAADLDDIFAHVRDLDRHYPDIAHWFYQVVVPGIAAGHRSILLTEKVDGIAGVAIIKNCPTEKKLCTLRIMPEFEGAGLGPLLFSACLKSLGTARPLISVSCTQYDRYKRLFSYFGFLHKASYKGLYRPGKYELSFNGLLYLEARD